MFDFLATLFDCIRQIIIIFFRYFVIVIFIIIIRIITSWRCVLLMVINIPARRIFSSTSKSVGSAGSVKFKPNQFEASVKTTGCERCEKTSDKVGTAEDDGKEERLSKAIEKKQCNATVKVESKLDSDRNAMLRDVDVNEENATEEDIDNSSSVENRQDTFKVESMLGSNRNAMSKDVDVNEENSPEEETHNASSVARRQEIKQDVDTTDEDSPLDAEIVELTGNRIKSFAKMDRIFVNGMVAAGINYEDLLAIAKRMQIKIEDLAQKFGILDNKCRVTMLELWAAKARIQGNMRFRDDLKKATEEFLGEKIDDDEGFTSYKKFCRLVVKLVPEDKWMRFVRLHLNLEEEEIQNFKRRFATFSDEQARQFAKKIRANGIDPAVTGRKLLIGVKAANYVMNYF